MERGKGGGGTVAINYESLRKVARENGDIKFYAPGGEVTIGAILFAFFNLPIQELQPYLLRCFRVFNLLIQHFPLLLYRLFLLLQLG